MIVLKVAVGDNVWSSGSANCPDCAGAVGVAAIADGKSIHNHTLIRTVPEKDRAVAASGENCFVSFYITFADVKKLCFIAGKAAVKFMVDKPETFIITGCGFVGSGSDPYELDVFCG